MKKREVTIMGKFMTVFLCVILLCTFSSCSLNSSSDEVSFQQVDPSSLKDSNLEEMLNDNLKDGIYELRTDKKCYIIFNGIENSYKDITYEIKDKIFEITLSKDKLTEQKQIVYELTLPESIDTIDTIELIQDGEETAFQSINLY